MPVRLESKRTEKPLDSCTTGAHASKLMCLGHKLRKGGWAVEMGAASVGLLTLSRYDRSGVKLALVANNNTLRCK